MSSATTPSGSVSFSYNGLEQRARKASSSSTSYYVYDEQGQLLGEYDANGTPIYETVYLNSTPVGALKQTGTAANGNIAVAIYNMYADQIDTPRVITQQDHQIVWRWDTAEAFGATAPNQDPSGLGAFMFNQRFPGQVFDAETGLNQNTNREYNARTGRYTQFDPIGLRGGLNGFSYVANQPLNASDPTGQFIVPVFTAAVGAFAGGAASYLIQRHYQGKCEVDWRDVANAATWGAVAGAALPFAGGSVAGAAGIGALSGVGQYMTSLAWSDDGFSAGALAWSAATGAIGGGVGGKFSRAMGYPGGYYQAAGTALPAMANQARDAATVAANAGFMNGFKNGVGAFFGGVPNERASNGQDCTCKK
jgi:RHS repeat-associated protein